MNGLKTRDTVLIAFWFCIVLTVLALQEARLNDRLDALETSCGVELVEG